MSWYVYGRANALVRLLKMTVFSYNLISTIEPQHYSRPPDWPLVTLIKLGDITTETDSIILFTKGDYLGPNTDEG